MVSDGHRITQRPPSPARVLVLADGGLARALRTLARRSAIPAELDIRIETRLPERVEVATYYVVSEALTNTAKHAWASVVRIAAEVGHGP